MIPFYPRYKSTIKIENISEVHIGPYRVKGIQVDAKSRCSHWHSEVDVVALRFPEDEIFYPCYECYEAIHQTLPKRWKKESFESALAILCGNCGTAMHVSTYLQAENQCPNCQHPFNPGCAKHYPYYFE